MPLLADGDAFKLALANHHHVVIPGGDAGAEALAVCPLKILFGGYQDFGGGVEPINIRPPLLRQVVGDHKQGLFAQAQALHFHGGGRHRPRLACAHHVGQERISTVQDAGYTVYLVGV